MGEKSERAGVVVSLIAAVAWLSCIEETWLPYIVAGGVLYIEQNEWVKKQMIQLLVLFSACRVFNCLIVNRLISEIINGIVSGVSLIEWLRVTIYTAEDLLFAYLAYRAWKNKDTGFHSLEELAERMLRSGKRSDKRVSNVCLNCGKPIGKDMDFCVYCGNKLN